MNTTPVAFLRNWQNCVLETVLMKTLQKNIMQKWGFLAIATLAFSLSTLAHAADVEAGLNELDGAELLSKEGVSLQELKSLTRNKLEFVVEDQTLKIRGAIPESCVKGGKASVIPDFDEKTGRNVITIRLSEECEKPGFRAPSTDKLKALSQIIPPIALVDRSGPLHVKYLKGGVDPDSDERVDVSAPILDKSGKAIVIVSSADKNKAAEKAAKAQAERDRKDKINEILKTAEGYCDNGNYDEARKAIESAEELFGDVRRVIASLSSAQRDSYLAKLLKAKRADDARGIREKYIATAAEKDWDINALDAPYIKQRFAIILGKIELLKSDKAGSSSAIDREIVAFERELREWSDYDIVKKNQMAFANSYGELALAERANGNHAASETYYGKGIKYDPAGEGFWRWNQMKEAQAQADACRAALDEKKIVIRDMSPAGLTAASKRLDSEFKTCAKNAERAEGYAKTADAKLSGEKNSQEVYDKFLVDYGSVSSNRADFEATGQALLQRSQQAYMEAQQRAYMRGGRP